MGQFLDTEKYVPKGQFIDNEPESKGDFLPSSIPEYMRFKFYSDRASSKRADYLNEAFMGRTEVKKALKEGNKARDYWMTQAGRYEDLSIKDFTKHPVKFVAGETAGLVPYMMSSQEEGLKYGAMVGGGFAAIAATAGQLGPQVLFPEEFFTVPASFAVGMKVGYSYGVFMNMLKREGASFFGDMVEKKISAGTSQVLGVAVGTLNALLELAQFKTLSKPFKQAFSKVIKTKVGKAAIVQALGRYSKNLGINVLQEDLQEVVPLVAETIGGMVDEKPDAIPTKGEWATRLLETTVRSAVGMAAIGVPGGAVDVTTSLRTEKIIKKKEDAVLLDKIIKELKEKEEGKKTLKEPVIAKEGQEGQVTPAIDEKVEITQIEEMQPETQENIKTEISQSEKLVSDSVRKILNKNLNDEIDAMEKKQNRRLSILEKAKIELSAIDATIKAVQESPEYNVYGVNIFEGKQKVLKSLWQDKKMFKEKIKNLREKEISKKESQLLKEKVLNIVRGIREGTIKTKRDVKSTQTSLIELFEDAGVDVPARLQKNIQTNEQLRKALPDIEERIARIQDINERRELIDDLRGSFKEDPNVPIEYKDLLENIKSKVLLKKRGRKAKAQLESTREFVERMAEEGTEINIPQEKLALLDKTSTDEMTTQELRDLQETIERLYHQGRLKNKLLAAMKERKFDEVKTELINIITRGKGLSEDSAIVKALREQNENLKNKSFKKIRDFIIINMRPELMINILDGDSPGLATDVLFNSLWESQKSELQEGKKTLDTIKDIHKNLNFAEIFAKKYNIGDLKGLTKDNMMCIYALSKNNRGLQRLYNSGLTDEDIQAMSEILSASEKKSINDMFRYYSEYQYPILDKIYVAMNGIHLYKEKNYFKMPRSADVSYQKEIELDALERSYAKKAGVKKGFTETRINTKKALSEFSYFGLIFSNHRQVEHYKAFAQSIRDVNKVLNNPEIRTAIKEKFGDKYFQVLDKWLKDVAYGADKQSMDWAEKHIKYFRTNFVPAVLGFNLLSITRAPISFIQGAEMAGKWNTTKALAKFISAPLDWNSKIDEKSTLMKFRPMRQEREMNEMVMQRTLQHRIDKVTGRQLIKEKSMLPWAIVDKTTCDIVWLAAYEGAKSDNMSEQKAINHADMVIRRTQPISGALNLPDTFRGREYQKLLTLFRNQPNQNFNLLLETSLKNQKGTISKADFSSHLIFYWIVPAVIFGISQRKRLPEDVGEFAKDILNGAFGGLIFWGNITNMLASGFKGTLTPLQSVYDDFYYFFNSKDLWKKLDSFVSLVNKAKVGLPKAGVERIIKGEPFGKPAKSKKKTINAL